MGYFEPFALCQRVFFASMDTYLNNLFYFSLCHFHKKARAVYEKKFLLIQIVKNTCELVCSLIYNRADEY